MSSQETKVYLKGNAMIEPLFNQWYAWSYLISPATSAMYISNLHLKLMESFIAAPQVHVAALKNPANLGGPFINYSTSRVAEIKALREKTLKENQPMLAFAEAVKTLDKILVEEADGLSLEPLYRKVPEPLKGYVELVYDLNSQPSIRFIEGLLYRSPYYNPRAQSLTLTLAERDERSFVFSTPRLETKDALHLELPFNHPGLDELFKMKETPQTLGHVMEALEIKPADAELFSTMFTEEAPRRTERFNGEGVRVRYFGHACVLIESKNVSILCDPVISYPCSTGLERYSLCDLPEHIDYVLVTHNHQDHCMFETLLQLRHKIGTIIVPKNNGGALVDPSLKLVLQQIGFRRVSEIDEMESIEVDGGAITGLPFLGEHADLNIRSKIAYLINLEGKSIVCAADSNNIEPQLYGHLQDAVGEIDVFLVGMECDGAPLSWLYGPLLTRPLPRKVDQSRRFDGSNFEKAFDIVKRLRPQQVYVYAMGQEPWLTYLTSIQYTDASRPIVESNRLVQECTNLGLTTERLYGHKEILLSAGSQKSQAAEI
ncbi:MAG TPA: MBL fold metallo-hydrolase [Pyrinomonadaceae bacterium]|nr:MBL fold metallo-hydrolase [Pyrinomonadaceae bacterium]